MKVVVIAPFELRGQQKDGGVELPEGGRVRDVLRLAVNPPIYARLLPVSVNGAQAKGSQVLQEGDVVIFIMPRTGG